MTQQKGGFLDVFRSRRMAVIFFLGFSSGLPLLLTGQTLQAWLTAEHVTLKQIAAFSLIGLAYTFKFTWAALLDRFALPFLGRRRGWMLVFQLGLVVAIAAMGAVDPTNDPTLLAVLALCVAVCSASQDILVDAFNTDTLEPHERAAGSSIYFVGYRIAMLVAGTVALVMADHVVWQVIYTTMAALMLIGVVATFIADEPRMNKSRANAPPAWVARLGVIGTILAAFQIPIVEFVKRLGWRYLVLILLFTALYKFGDSFSQTLLIAFFKNGSGFDFSKVPDAELPQAFGQAVVANIVKRGTGFQFTEIALMYKLVGFAGIFIGGVTGGSLVARYGVRRMLIVFGMIQATTHVLYAWLAVVGHNLPLLGASVFIDTLSGAMGMSAFMAFLMSVCNPSVSATQFALLTSLSSVGQRVFGPFAATLVAALGWPAFYVVTTFFAIPGLILAYVVGRMGEPREKLAPTEPDG